MKYYSAIKKNEILPSVTTWMDLEGIVLSEIRQTEKEISYALTYIWNLKKKKTHTYTHPPKKQKTELKDTKNRLMVAKGGRVGVGKMGECGQKIQMPSYKINKSWGCKVQHGDYS